MEEKKKRFKHDRASAKSGLRKTDSIQDLKETQRTLNLSVSLPPLAAGMDPSHHPLAGEPRSRADHARHAAEAGGFP